MKYISPGFLIDNSVKCALCTEAGLYNIEVPEGIEYISDGFCKYNSSLRTLELPSTLKGIDFQGFYDVGSKYSSFKVYCAATTPPTTFNSLLPGFNKEQLTIYVPTSSVSAYKSASGWAQYADYIQGYEF